MSPIQGDMRGSLMRILFIEPPISVFDVPTGVVCLPEPLALETVAAPLQGHHDLHILDMRIEPDALNATLESFQPHIVATGAVTANIHITKTILKQAKQFSKNILTVIGGHHVSFRPQDTADSFIDVIAIGEADETMPEVVAAFERGDDFGSIPGIVYNKDGQQFRTPGRPLLHMDTLDIPARHLVDRYRDQYFQRANRPIVSINTSRGCPYRCTFCSLWKLNNGKYRTRSAELVVDEIESFEEDFVDCIDDNSIADRKRAHKIADLLLERGIKKKFKMYARADTIAKSPDLMDKLAQAGLDVVLVGFETADPDRLTDWNKGSSMNTSLRAIEVLKDNGIKVISYFVVDPDFTKKDFDNLWRYVDEMGLMTPTFTVLVPFPGTDLFDERRDQIVFDDFRLYDFFHTLFEPRLPLQEFYGEFADLYAKAYAKERQAATSDLPPEMQDRLNKMFGELFSRIYSLSEHHDEVMV